MTCSPMTADAATCSTPSMNPQRRREGFDCEIDQVRLAHASQRIRLRGGEIGVRVSSSRAPGAPSTGGQATRT